MPHLTYRIRKFATANDCNGKVVIDHDELDRFLDEIDREHFSDITRAVTYASSNSPNQCRYIWSLADNGWADHTCSSCGYTENTDIHVYLDWNYCPHCGAWIVKGDE